MEDHKILDIASGLREWTDDVDSKLDHFKGSCAELMQQVRLSMSSSADNYVPPMDNEWQAKCMSHFPWDDTSPPMSHIGTPTEDFGLPSDPLPAQPISHHSTCSSLKMPMISTITTMAPPVQSIAPPAPIAAVQQSMLSTSPRGSLSTSPQGSLAMKHFNLSTVSDTPTPSPSSNDEECSASSPMSDKQSLSEYNEDLGICKSKQEILKLIPKDVRVPQRKGNMQLWQFLYAILEDQTDIIEWTANKSEYEFRLLQPDVVAIWWGHQKNRQNMNYDKLSRSLRYYYNRKIITKVNSERYVYRFCCNPELLYSVLGNTHAKPKLKDMPVEAKQILEWNQGLPGSRSSVSPLPQLLRAPSPSHVTPVNYIHPLKNEVNLPTTCATDTISIPPNYFPRHQPIDPSFMPPQDYYYTPCSSYPSMMPAPCYPPYIPTSSIGPEWEHYPFSL